MACLLFLPSSCFAWETDGHRVVAQIAYDHLTPKTKAKVNQQINVLTAFYPQSKTFVAAANWADILKMQDVSAFNAWHYISIPYNQGGKRGPKPPPQNVVWAINQCITVLSSSKATPFEKALFLRFLIHFVGDLHQPLHAITLYNPQFPKGDRGGGLYAVDTTDANNLHQYWDSGLGLFDEQEQGARLSNASIKKLANQLEKDYPESSFGPKVNDLNPWDWAQESNVLGRQYAYSLPEDGKPNKKYVEQGQVIASKQMALAGYRLAALLNEIEG